SGAGRVTEVPTVTSPQAVAQYGHLLATLHVAEPILRYISEIGAATRAAPRLRLGASTRGLRALVRCVQVYAAAQGRHFVVPSDVQRLAVPVLAHRMVLTREAVLAGVANEEVLGDAVNSVPVPRPTP
ncbi:MAG: ATPase, partial [Kibdelosporangium sp.]